MAKLLLCMPALPANIEFSNFICRVVFQLNSDYGTKVVTGCLHCIMLNYEARRGYYKDAINLNSQTGQRNTGMHCYGQLSTGFQKGNFTSFQSVCSCLSVYTTNISQMLCLFDLELVFT